jgi:hypothetical protein
MCLGYVIEKYVSITRYREIRVSSIHYKEICVSSIRYSGKRTILSPVFLDNFYFFQIIIGQQASIPELLRSAFTVFANAKAHLRQS